MKYKVEPFQLYKPEHVDYDIAQLLTGFEAGEKILDENATRIRYLRRSKDDSYQELANKIGECVDGYPCGSTACRRCTSQFRRYLIGEMLRHFAGKKLLRMVTIVPFADAFKMEQLESFNPQSLMKRVRRQLKDVGFGSLVAMGGLELDFDVDLNLWQPHLHFICAGAASQEFKEFRCRFYSKARHPGNRKGKQEAVKINLVKDQAKAFSYCMKLYWVQLVKYSDVHGKVRYRDRRLKVDEHNRVMVKLDSMSIGDLTFLMGVKRRGKFVG
jgi:hypothetical protein